MAGICSQCGTQCPPTKRCAMCKQVNYCGVECQRAAWKQHKKTCKPPPPSALWTAAAEGFSEEVRHLLADRPDMEERGSYYQTSPLHVAASQGHEQCVLMLLENGADVGANSRHRRTALHDASSEGHLGTLMILLQHGAEVSATSSCGSTGLHDAASSGHVEVLKLLLQHGAEVSPRAKNNTTPLHHAVFGDSGALGDDQVEAMRVLLEHGADTSGVENTPECNGETLLHWASGEDANPQP